MNNNYDAIYLSARKYEKFLIERGISKLFSELIADRKSFRAPNSFLFYSQNMKNSIINDIDSHISDTKINYFKFFKEYIYTVILFFMMIIYFFDFTNKKILVDNKIIIFFSLTNSQMSFDQPYKFNDFIHDNRFMNVFKESKIIVETKSNFFDKNFRGITYTFDANLYLFKKLPDRKMKLKVLGDTINRIGKLFLPKNYFYFFALTEYIVYDPIWSVVSKILIKPKIITTQSQFEKLPLIFYHSECCKIDTIAIWYSANNVPVRLHGSDHAYDESRNILAHINTHFVWSMSSKKYLIKLNPEKNVLVVGSIMFYTAEKKIPLTRNVYTITIFDVNAYSNFKTPIIYTDEVMSDFIGDLFDVFEHNIKSKNFTLRIKHKRNKLKIDSNKGYIYGTNYEKILAELETKSYLHVLDTDSNLYNTVAESDLIVGIPFTSPCFIAKETKVPSIFYVPSSGLIWDFPDEIDGIPVIKNISNLKKYLSR